MLTLLGHLKQLFTLQSKGCEMLLWTNMYISRIIFGSSLEWQLSGTLAIKDVSAAILAQSREQVTKAREAVDDVLDYVVSHVPLPWVVGPFAPSLVELPDAPTSKVEDDVQASKEPKGKLGSPPKAPSEPKKDI
uniref:Uncharacterized protein n=1 Tax=Sphaerodactylus townsendi TaxID=933632 RepID=A0ACB8ECW6_9SAUR